MSAPRYDRGEQAADREEADQGQESAPQPQPPPRWTRYVVRRPSRIVRRILIGFFALLLVALCAAFVLLKTEWAANKIRDLVVEKLGKELDSDVRIGRLSLELFPTAVILHDVSLTPRGRAELVSVRRVEVQLRLLELLRKHVALDRVIVDGAEVQLDIVDGKIVNLPRLPQGKDDKAEPWRIDVTRVQLRQSGVRTTMRGTDAAHAAAVQQVTAWLLRLGGAPAASAPSSLAARLEGLSVDLWSLPGATWAAELEAVSGTVLAGAHKHVLTRLRTAGSYTNGDATLDHFEIALGGIPVALFASGHAKNVLTLARGGAGAYAGKVVAAGPVPLLARILERPLQAEGTFTLDADLGGSSAADVSATGRVGWRGARIGKHRLGDIGVRFVASRAAVSFDQTELEFARGKIAASGRLRFGKAIEVEAKLGIRELHLERLLEAVEQRPVGVDLLPHGTVVVKGKIFTGKGGLRPELSAVADLSVRDLVVAGRSPGKGAAAKPIVAIPSIAVKANLRVTRDKVFIDEALVRLGSSRFRASGEIIFRRSEVRIDVVTPEVRLEEVGTIGGFPWTGHGPVRATIRYVAGKPVVTGTFDLAGLSFARVDLEHASGMIQYQDDIFSLPLVTAARGTTRIAAGVTVGIRGEVQIDAETRILRGRTEDLMRILRIPRAYHGRVSSDITGVVRFSGPLRNLTGSGEVRLTDAVVRVESVRESIHEVIARGKFTGKAWEVEEVKVRKTPNGGRFEVSGVITMPDRALNLVVFTEGLSLDEFNLPALKQADLHGDVTLLATIQGTLANPQGTGSLTLRNSKVYGIRQHDSALQFWGDGKRLSVLGKMLGDDVGVQGTLVFNKALDFSGAVTLRGFQFSSLLKGEAQQLKGTVSGKGTFSGRATQLSSIEGDLTLPQVEVTAGGSYTVKNAKPVQIRIEGGKADIRSLSISGQQETKLNASGTVSFGGALNLKLSGDGPLSFLQSFVKNFQVPEGRALLDARVTGNIRDPGIFGTLTVQGVRLASASFPYDVRDLGARLGFTQNQISIENLTGSFSDGKIRGEGRVTLKRFIPTEFKLDVRIDETGLVLFDDVQTRLGGELNVSGGLQQVKIGGDVRVARVRYSKDIDLTALLLRKRRVVPKSPPLKTDWLNRIELAVKVRMPDDVRISNNVADLEFGGEVDLRGTLRDPSAVGVLRLVRPGSFKIPKNTYKTDRAFVVFKEGTSPTKPHIDIEGVTRVRTYDITFSIKGQFPDLKPDWSCGSGLAREDCIALTQYGLTLKELNTVRPADRNVAGLSAALGTLGTLTGFESKIAEAVPIFDTFRVASGYSEYSSTIVPLLTVGKQLTRTLAVYGTTSLIEPSKDYRAQVELNLKRNLALTGEYAPIPRTGVTAAGVGQSLGNLGIDLRWRFEF